MALLKIQVQTVLVFKAVKSTIELNIITYIFWKKGLLTSKWPLFSFEIEFETYFLWFLKHWLTTKKWYYWLLLSFILFLFFLFNGV